MKKQMKQSLSIVATTLLLGTSAYSMDIDNVTPNQIMNIPSLSMETINLLPNQVNDLTINNSGELRAGVGAAVVVGENSHLTLNNNNYVWSSPGNSIENNGNIDFVNNYLTWGNIVNNGEYAYIQNNLGKDINGSIINNTEMDIVNNGNISGGITNNENGILTLINGTNAYINGNIVNYGNMDLTSHTSIVNTFSTSTLTNNGTLQIGLGSNYVSNYVASPASITSFQFKTQGNMPTTDWSELNGKNITFNDGATVNINVTNDSTNTTFLANQSFIIIKASIDLDVQGRLNVTDNSALLNFRTTYTDGQELSVIADIAQTVSDTVNNTVNNNDTNTNTNTNTNTIDTHESLTKYTNAQGAAKVLDSIIANQQKYAAMDSFISKLNTLSTNDDVAKAVESTTPVSTSSAIVANTQIMNNVTNIVSQRQSTTISNGMNSGDIFSEMFVDNNLWIKTFGSIGSQNDKSGINGFDLKTYGLGFGADTKYKSDKTFGLGFFYTNANVDVNNMDQSTDLDVFTMVAYGSSPIIDNRTNFLYQVGYTLQKNNSLRGIALTNEVAEADYTTQIANLDLKLQRDYQITKELLLQPYVNSSYKHISNPSYSESGAGALNLNVDKFTTSELVVGLGTDASYSLDKVSKLTANVGLGYDLQDKKQIVTSSYAGAVGTSFDTMGIDNGRYSYEAGVGYDRNITKTSSISVNYNYQAEGSDFSNNVVSAKYTLNF